jgi:hypothetical protein
MKKLSSFLFIISLISLAIGLSDVGSGIFSGLIRAAGAVFFVLAYITRVIEKAEAEETGQVQGEVEGLRAEGDESSAGLLTPAHLAH